MGKLKLSYLLPYFILAAWPLFNFYRVPPHSVAIFVSAIVASFLLCALFYFGKFGVKIVAREFSLPQQIALLYIAAFQLAQLWLTFPGLVSPDDLFMLHALYRGQLSPWHSNSYSIFISAGKLIFLHPFLCSILNSILVCFSFFLLLRIFPKLMSQVWLLLLCLLFSMPQVAFFGVYENRDTLNSLLLLWLCYGFIAQKTEANRDPWFQIPCLAILALILGDVRQDGKIIVLLFPFAITWLQKRSLAFLGRLSFVLYLTSAAIVWIPSHYFNLDAYSSDYKSTAYINPLSHIFHSKGLSAATPEELGDLDLFFHVDYLITYYDLFDIAPFHHGGVRHPNTPEQFAAFQSAAQKIILRNLPLFFENRIRVGAVMLNFSGWPPLVADILRNRTDLTPEQNSYIPLNFKPLPATPTERKYLDSMLYYFCQMPEPFRVLFSSCFIPLLVSIGFLFLWRSRPELFLVSFLGLTRLSAILLLAPAAYFKYISSFWLMGWIMLLYFLASRGNESAALQTEKSKPELVVHL